MSSNNSIYRFATLSVILLIGIFVRAVLWWSWNGQPIQIDDAKDYHDFAVRLVETGSYINPTGELSSMRPPLYPWVLSLIYRLFGVDNDGAVRGFQAIVSLFTVLFVYRIGVRIYSEAVGLLAAGITCFYPSLLGFNNLILSETLFTFLVVVSTWFFVEAIYQQSVLMILFAAAVLGLATLTRSITMLSIPFFAFLILTTWRCGWGRRIATTLVFVASFSLVIAPWSYRNTRIQKAFTLIDVMGGRNAMMGNYEYTPLERSWATITLVTGEKSWDAVLRREHPEVKGMTQGQLDKVALKHGLHFVFTHPVLTAQRTMVRFFNFWQLERTLVAGAQQKLWGEVSKQRLVIMAIVICGSYAVVIFLAMFGLILVPPVDRRYGWLLVTSVAIPCLVHTAIFAHERYRLPSMPLIILFASAACVNYREIWSCRREWTFKLAAMGCVVLILGWVREVCFADLSLASQIFP